ncbi:MULTISPECIES: hypothetical protein [unclassified Streptomyces]|uniref:hypothetical protein n=1 Tax=unclassified Streptomyces TaxID=2593676 RepID=UPI001489E646|nr:MULTISPECIES: hypothetical protein [unclassified Streptomyces]
MKTTTMEDAPRLGLPLEWPEPPADCGVCQALVRQRAAAAARNDQSRVSDFNVEIRNHHDDRPRRRQR